LSNYYHMHTIDIDRTEPKTEFQVEQVQKAYHGPQASSCEDTNIAFGSRQAPVHHTKSLALTF
jgi:hypothetical protein